MLQFKHDPTLSLAEYQPTKGGGGFDNFPPPPPPNFATKSTKQRWHNTLENTGQTYQTRVRGVPYVYIYIYMCLEPSGQVFKTNTPRWSAASGRGLQPFQQSKALIIAKRWRREHGMKPSLVKVIGQGDMYCDQTGDIYSGCEIRFALLVGSCRGIESFQGFLGHFFWGFHLLVRWAGNEKWDDPEKTIRELVSPNGLFPTPGRTFPTEPQQGIDQTMGMLPGKLTWAQRRSSQKGFWVI